MKNNLKLKDDYKIITVTDGETHNGFMEVEYNPSEEMIILRDKDEADGLKELWITPKTFPFMIKDLIKFSKVLKGMKIIEK